MASKRIIISDTTLSAMDDHCSFKEKIDIITKLDSLGVDAIEIPAIENVRADTLLLHTVAPLVKNAAIFCCSGYSEAELDNAWEAVKGCAKPGITVSLPTSTVQMEFLCHKKAPAMLALAETLIRRAVSYGCQVEFKAEDASRSEPEFLSSIIGKAIASGASTITLCDSTGQYLPDEIESLVSKTIGEINAGASDVSVGVQCSDIMSVAAANSVASAAAGATVIKTSCVGNGASPLAPFADVINKRSEKLDLFCGINYPVLVKVTTEIKETAETKKSGTSPFDTGVRDNEGDRIVITGDDDADKIVSIAASLGYELSDSDADKVYENVHRLAQKKAIGKREFEAVIATSAMQIPSTYTVKSYVINSGNVITSTAHVELEKQGETISGISTGDGPIDAAFLSIEQIIGRHFELDDFQIRSVTEGREAVGEALVKIRYNGKLYSGRGVSTDIIGASIYAYVKALNKICYEEDM